MAFNFNWSPLIADTSRARDMLTNALNKSPKPPIIVDDIIVTELNLGAVPPELEILEIGDLAEDRFRGIFKMLYSGDAYLTLKTRIQANPLNTNLSNKPAFASPQPLAAASGLTIPLQITLSDIRLSGFVILVFSKQKGITLVFRNDPLESLKVSSTFDSIPFVRDYLQRQIEGQIRVLFMEHLPAIIHRLSLRVFVKDHVDSAEINSNRLDDPADRRDETPVDPLATVSQAPADPAGRPLVDDDSGLAVALDDPSGTLAFSQKNLLRLATLTDSHRSLSLFTPPINDVLFRAWAGAAEGRDLHRPPPHHMHGASGFTLATLSRLGSAAPSKAGSVHSFSSEPAPAATSPTSLSSAAAAAVRPSTSTVSTSTYSMGSTLSASGAARARGQRKRKHRVVNLRTAAAPDESLEHNGPSSSAFSTDPAPDAHPPSQARSVTASSSSWATSSEREGELQTPPDSPEKKAKNPAATPLARALDPDAIPPLDAVADPFVTPRASQHHRQHDDRADAAERTVRAPRLEPGGPLSPRAALTSQPSSTSLPSYSPRRPDEPAAVAQPGGILEQAWMMKMAAEIARKAAAERARGGELDGKGEGGDGAAQEGGPPPAYVA